MSEQTQDRKVSITIDITNEDLVIHYPDSMNVFEALGQLTYALHSFNALIDETRAELVAKKGVSDA